MPSGIMNEIGKVSAGEKNAALLCAFVSSPRIRVHETACQRKGASFIAFTAFTVDPALPLASSIKRR